MVPRPSFMTALGALLMTLLSSSLPAADVSADLVQHVEDALRVALPIEPDALVDVVADDLDHASAVRRAGPIERW